MDDRHDTLFDEDESEKHEPAHVDFDLLDTTGRWFLKVLSGPNTGAEFNMQSGSSYLVGTDAASCDIVFQDLSVSRQHARISIDSQDHAAVEDLNSRNGTFVDGEKLTARKAITTNALVSMGTTTFMLVDREGQRETIVSPLLAAATGEKKEEIKPESVPTKTPGEELGPIPQAILPPMQSEVERIKEEERKEARISHAISALVVLASITGLLVIVGVGTTFLFKTQEVPHQHITDADAIISKALKDYPAIRYSFNPASGRLLLIGHVLTPLDRNQLLSNLQDLKFVTQVDATNVVIDELVWREINQVISKNPAWRGVSITSPVAGKFILSGFLKTRKQAEDLYDYVSQNFQYVDLLEKKVVVEEDLKAQISQKLTEAGFKNLQIALNNGDLTLSGSIANGSIALFNATLAEIKALPGIRGVQSLVNEVAPEQTLVNISDRYQVSGYSLQGNNVNVVINGKILTKGDIIDGMTITEISTNTVFLEKDGIRYRIDFNR